jgi:uncharacterized protein YcnI
MGRMGRTLQLALAAIVASVPAVLYAHATVAPAASRPGAYERYVLRVPNESDNATVRVEIRFPDGVRVISFQDVPGWKLQATMDSTGRAVSAVWTGSLPPERFVELPFIGVNPKEPSRLVWPVIQTYANGERAEWTGAPDSDRPASVTEIGAAPGAPASRSSPWPLVVATAALVLAALAVIITLSRSAPRAH